MTADASDRAARDLRVVVLAPSGNDSVLVKDFLARAGIRASVCPDVAALCAQIEEGAGAAIVAEEALTMDAMERFLETLRKQPAWSDFPIVLFATPRESPDADLRLLDLLDPLGNVTLLERPLRPVVLVSALRSAARARQRQYDVRDLTARIDQSVKERDRFLATLSHELRNPLGAILHAVQILDRVRAPDGAQSPERDVLRRQTRHLGRLVDDLLDVSRVTSQKIALRTRIIDLRAVVQRTLRGVELGDSDKASRVKTSFPATPVLVRGDAVRLEQVVMNLVTNALKFTPVDGTIELTLAEDGDECVMRVKDTGIGISPDLLPRVFDLFTQGQVTADRAKGGLGIGLTLVRSIVLLHGGEIVARSAGLRRGSEFVVRMPRAQGAEPAVTPEPALTARAHALHEILVVEDDADNREMLGILLEHLGYKVRYAEDGPTAVALAKEKRPDAAIVDIGLPGFDGYEVARQLRAERGRIYLIALTGYGQADDRRQALLAGFDAHITKPTDLETVERTLAAGSNRPPTEPPA
jgi:signal transduction histidine kinase/ActR/RegA family two-component response regulator